MSPFSDDDQDLVEFLRQHRSPSPPPAVGLENAIIRAIAKPSDRAASRRWNSWIAAPAIAASLITVVLSYRALVPPQPSAGDVATLEAFIETNWHDTVSNNSDTELISINDE
ncbi:MAG: hypothetical protein LH702_24275 [Phormidesmis sp. CAN_BIN44]|nr:hypothetical protein [Phormidesmis sp. CAN_BIN44]